MPDHEIISYDELFEVIENDSTDNHFRAIGQSLLEALNDWPTINIKEPQHLVVELRNEIKDSLTFDNLNKYSQNLSAKSDLWKMEGLASILQMFNYTRKADFKSHVVLEDIITDLTKHYRKRNI